VSSSQIKFVNTTNSPAMVFKYKLINYSSLSSFSTNSSGELDVFGHDSDSLGVDGAQVGIFEQSYEVSFTGLLKSSNCSTLESEIGFEVLSDLTDQSLEGEFSDEQFCALLISSDFPQSDCSRPVSMGLFDSSSGWGTFPGCLGCQLFPWGFSSGGFTGGLLGTGHLCKEKG